MTNDSKSPIVLERFSYEHSRLTLWLTVELFRPNPVQGPSARFPATETSRREPRESPTWNTRIVSCILTVSTILCLFTLALRGQEPDIEVYGSGSFLLTSGDLRAIRIVDPDGTIALLRDNLGRPMSFANPLTSIAYDPLSGDTYVADFDQVYRLSAQGFVSIYAGNRNLDSSRSHRPSGQHANQFPLHDVVSITFDSVSETLYIGEYRNRILAVRNDRVHHFAQVGIDESMSDHKSHQFSTDLGGPIVDMVSAPDGSLYVANRKYLYRFSPRGLLMEQVSVDKNLGEFKYIVAGRGVDWDFARHHLTGLALNEGSVYLSTARVGIFRMDRTGNIEKVFPDSGDHRGGRIVFTSQGYLGAVKGERYKHIIDLFSRSGWSDRFLLSSTARIKSEDPQIPRRDIYGGKEVRRGDWPFVVHITSYSSVDEPGLCTGSLVAPNWVLTAAHCVDGRTSASVKACYDVSDSTTCIASDIGSKKMVIHEKWALENWPDEYHPHRAAYDIALIELEEEINWIQPVRLLDRSELEVFLRFGGDNTAVAVGWGATDGPLSKSGGPVNVPREVAATVYSHRACEDFTKNTILGFIPAGKTGFHDNTLCFHDRTKGTDNGDSGGPLLVNISNYWAQIGITAQGVWRSRGWDGLVWQSPSFNLDIFAGIAGHYQWIFSHIGTVGVTSNFGVKAVRGERFRDCNTCPWMVSLHAGTFTMGDGRYISTSPAQRVTIERDFAVGVFEVTFGEWDACVRAQGCREYQPSDEGWGRGQMPVINVSWEDARAYVQWLSRRTGNVYRLLTEAEWEYAARAGVRTRWGWGDAWQSGLTNTGSRRTKPVGSYHPDRFGLHDMLGNVDELTEDCWNWNLRGSPNDGSAWWEGDCLRRVARGGNFKNGPELTSLVRRSYRHYRSRASHVGFRVAREVLRDDYGNDITAAQKMQVGDSRRGTISTGGDADLFEVNIPRAGLIRIHSTGDADTLGVLYDRSGRQIQWDDDSGDQRNFLIEEEVHSESVRYVRVMSGGLNPKKIGEVDTGDYILHIELRTNDEDPELTDDHADRLIGATPLEAGTPVGGRINPASDIDVFRIQIENRVTLEVYTTGSLDTVGTLTDSSGRPLAQDDDGGDGTNFRIYQTLSEGTYYAMVESYANDSVGSYSVHIVRRSASASSAHMHLDSRWMARASVGMLEELLDSGASVWAMDADGRTPLHLAARTNSNPALAEALLKRGASVFARDAHGRSPLHYAALGRGNRAVAELLLKWGGDPSWVSNDLQTPHDLAAESGNTAVADLLLNRGNRSTIPDPFRQPTWRLLYGDWARSATVASITAILDADPSSLSTILRSAGGLLHRVASLNSDVAVTRLLLDRGADPNATTSRGFPVVAAAASNPNPAVVELLLDHGADATDPVVLRSAARNRNPAVAELLLAHGADATNSSALYFAATNRNPAVARLLLDRGADPNEFLSARTPLHQAARFNPNAAVVELLLDRGANIHERVRDTIGGTALQLAVLNPDVAVAQLLIDRGADISNPLLYRRYYYSVNPAVVQLLLDAGGSIETATGESSIWSSVGGLSLLSETWFSKGSLSQALEWLDSLRENLAALDSGTLAEALSVVHGQDGLTAMHYAARNPDPAVARLLLDQGAVFAEPVPGWTALHEAAMANPNPAVARLLIERGADIHSAGADGWTPLHWAARANSNPAVARLLIERGASIGATAIEGTATALHTAARFNLNPAMVELLIDYGADITARDDGGCTPLLTAWLNRRHGVAAALLSRGAEPVSLSWNRLLDANWMKAATVTQLEAQVINASDEDFGTRDSCGRTPVHLLAHYTARSSDTGNYALTHWGRGWRLFLQRSSGASISQLDGSGNSALHYAVAGGVRSADDYSEHVLFDLIFRAKIDPALVGSGGLQAAHYSSFQGTGNFNLDSPVSRLIADQKWGDFAIDPLSGDPFPNRVVPQGRFDPCITGLP